MGDDLFCMDCSGDGTAVVNTTIEAGMYVQFAIERIRGGGEGASSSDDDDQNGNSRCNKDMVDVSNKSAEDVLAMHKAVRHISNEL